MREHSCIARMGLIFFGMRAVFGLDPCSLFPQCLLAIIPLIGGVQVRGSCTLQVRRGQWLAPSSGTLGSGSGLCPPLESEMAAAAHARPQSSCRQCLRVCVEKDAPMAARPPTVSPCLSGGPRPSTSHPSPFRLSPCSQPQSSPLGLTSKS